jgi:uncharacterized protein YndB with AHSA1/START domain
MVMDPNLDLVFERIIDVPPELVWQIVDYCRTGTPRVRR